MFERLEVSGGQGLQHEFLIFEDIGYALNTKGFHRSVALEHLHDEVAVQLALVRVVAMITFNS